MSGGKSIDFRLSWINLLPLKSKMICRMQDGFFHCPTGPAGQGHSRQAVVTPKQSERGRQLAEYQVGMLSLDNWTAAPWQTSNTLTRLYRI